MMESLSSGGQTQRGGHKPATAKYLNSTSAPEIDFFFDVLIMKITFLLVVQAVVLCEALALVSYSFFLFFCERCRQIMRCDVHLYYF